jgi:hypothetical protein
MKLNISDVEGSTCTRLIIPKKRIEESNRGDRGKTKSSFMFPEVQENLPLLISGPCIKILKSIQYIYLVDIVNRQ